MKKQNKIILEVENYNLQNTRKKITEKCIEDNPDADLNGLATLLGLKDGSSVMYYINKYAIKYTNKKKSKKEERLEEAQNYLTSKGAKINTEEIKKLLHIVRPSYKVK